MHKEKRAPLAQRIHLGRIVGGHRDHRHPNGPVVPGDSGRVGVGTSGDVPCYLSKYSALLCASSRHSSRTDSELSSAGILGENKKRPWPEYARFGYGEVKGSTTTPDSRRNHDSGIPSRDGYGLKRRDLAHKSAECRDKQHCVARQASTRFTVRLRFSDSSCNGNRRTHRHWFRHWQRPERTARRQPSWSLRETRILRGCGPEAAKLPSLEQTFRSDSLTCF